MVAFDGPQGDVLDLPHVRVVGTLEVARGQVGVPGDARYGVEIGRNGGADADLRRHLSMVRAGAAGSPPNGGFRD